MAYASITKPSLYFNTKLYTGNGSAGNAQTGVGFQPDFLWIKNRTAAQEHWLADAVRGTTKFLESNSNNAESSDGATGLASFDSDGFTVNGSARTNQNSASMVAWNWKANGSGSANTDGSITSTVSVNTTAGFSIVKYEASANATIGHGLGVKPAMVITKSRDDATNWASWHKDLTGGDEEDRIVNLNTTAAGDTYTNYWGTGGFTSSVFGVSNTGFHNNSNSMIAYCFAEKKGYSKFGSYTGNGNADGTFVYTGFKPAFIIVKRTSSGTQNWCLMDNKRGLNPDVYQLHPNTSGVETLGSGDTLDLLSNGFKFRTDDSDKNGSATYIYMAFAEEPLVANVGASIPATAR